MTRFYVQIIFIPVHNLLTGFPELDKDVNYDDYVYALILWLHTDRIDRRDDKSYSCQQQSQNNFTRFRPPVIYLFWFFVVVRDTIEGAVGSKGHLPRDERIYSTLHVFCLD